MILQQPIWFLLLMPLACVLYFRRIPSRLGTALRLVLVLLIVGAMVGPMIKLPTRSGTILVVADRSLSMPVEAKSVQKHAINLLLSHIGREDRLGVVSFAARSYPERLPAGAAAGEFGEFVSENQADASDLKTAIENAISLIPVGDKGRLLILSDGRWTGENPEQLISRLVQRGIAVDYRVTQRSVVGDIAILSLEAPDQVLPDEVFKVSAWVQVPTSQEIEFEWFYNGHRVASGRREMNSGSSKLECPYRAGAPGAIQCELRIRTPGSDDDPIPENNAARKLIGVEGDKPLLLLVPRPEKGGKPVSRLAEVLRQAALNVEVSDGGNLRWSLPLLSRYSGILIENASSSQIGTFGMELIGQWVRQTGAGLMFTGGKNAYALGGYYQSPLDEIMPVSMELRKEHRKLAVAVAILMDRSGSMGMMVPGGKIKMDLANLGTAEVLKILTPLDEVAVLTCDTGVQTVLPLKQNSNPQGDREKILRIAPGGGGIFVYTGLLATTKMLSQAQAETKHVILFTDADDTEEPGDFVKLLENCKKAGMTCSVIALGTEADSTADLCKDIAHVGGGNIYFTELPNDLPRLFAQDTFTISRSTFLEEPTPFHFTGGMLTLSGFPFASPPNLGGYNLCYVKPGALPGAVTDDEYKAPVIASWQAGLGRVLCYMGQVDGPFTGPMAGWSEYNSFLASLGRWTAGRMATLPNNMMLTQSIDDGSCQIRLHLDPEQPDPLGGARGTTPTVTVMKQSAGQGVSTESLPLRWLEPELLGVTVPLTGSETIQATLILRDENKDKPFPLPPVCLPYSPEFRPPTGGKGAETLKRLAATTGGVERIELPGMWKEIPKVPRYFDLSPWLIYAAIACLVLEVFQRRTGWLSAWFKRLFVKPVLRRKKREETPQGDDSLDKSISVFRRLAMQKERRKVMEQNMSETSEAPKPEKTVAAEKRAEPEPSDPGGGVFDALKKAKRESKQRTGDH